MEFILKAYITHYPSCWKVCFCPSWSQTILALSETAQDWAWFIHLLGHIWTAAVHRNSCWAHEAELLSDLPSFRFLWSLFQSHHLQIREFDKVMMPSQRGCGVCRVVFGMGCKERRRVGSLCYGGGIWLFCCCLSLQICGEEMVSESCYTSSSGMKKSGLQPVLRVQCLS